MKDCVSRSIDPKPVAQALRRLNRFHQALFWAQKYHGLSDREIAQRLRTSEELLASQLRIMRARFILAAEDVETGQRERITAKGRRLFEGLAWIIKLWAYRLASRSDGRSSGTDEG
jgi:hypothetical protein